MLEWFLAQKGRVKGFRKAVLSGFTTTELARIIDRVLHEHPEAQGLWHVSSEPIDKHALLTLIGEKFGLRTEIIPDDGFVCDRSLDSSRFRREFGYEPPSWDAQISELAERAMERAA